MHVSAIMRASIILLLVNTLDDKFAIDIILTTIYVYIRAV